jgi:phospholipid/cholesterol/gamma-HCH transport system substrate-binding protein
MRLAIDARYDLPEDSAAAVASEGLLGGSFVEIVPGESPFRLVDGDEIADTRAAQSLLGLLAEFVASTSE